VGLNGSRTQADPDFAALRTFLLGELGVEVDPGVPAHHVQASVPVPRKEAS
jgi:hypothetical protein